MITVSSIRGWITGWRRTLLVTILTLLALGGVIVSLIVAIARVVVVHCSKASESTNVGDEDNNPNK